MTKKLTELFDLPVDEPDDTAEFNEQSLPDDIESKEIKALETLTTLEKVEQAMPAIRGLEASDAEMDELAELAKNSYKDLAELGMNVEARFAPEIFQAASSFMGHAITAKNAKLNRKIKMIELQLRQAKLEAELSEQGEGSSSTGQVLDRNELLAEILKQSKNEEKK